LQDRVALDDASLPGVEAGPIQRVRCCPNKAVSARLGKPGVGIQSDDVADPLGHGGRLPADWNERGVPGSAKKPVQLVELSSLPLPADPLAFLLIPEASTMQQDKPAPASGRSLVSLVEARDAVGQRGEQIFVAGHALAGRVPPVAQQGKVEMAFGICQVVHLEPLDLLIDVVGAREQHRHHNQSSKLRRHALGELELGEQAGLNENRNQTMD
jgi:hypothetical protein